LLAGLPDGDESHVNLDRLSMVETYLAVTVRNEDLEGSWGDSNHPK
jgi:hypothetical protein